jgi:hypothetical protein
MPNQTFVPPNGGNFIFLLPPFSVLLSFVDGQSIQFLEVIS